MKQPTPEKLAAAGFFYTGIDDEVMSPFMLKQIGGWEEDDEPMKEVIFYYFGTKLTVFSLEISNLDKNAGKISVKIDYKFTNYYL